MTGKAIAEAIRVVVENSGSPKYSAWRVGLTHNPAVRKLAHQSNGEDTRRWKLWEADSLADAQAVEAFYIHQIGMKGGTGGDLDEDKRIFVYIF